MPHSLELLDGWPWPSVLPAWVGEYGPCRLAEGVEWSCSKEDFGAKGFSAWSRTAGCAGRGGGGQEIAVVEEEAQWLITVACQNYRHEHALFRRQA
jgi:hypothetical protein